MLIAHITYVQVEFDRSCGDSDGQIVAQYILYNYLSPISAVQSQLPLIRFVKPETFSNAKYS